MSKESFEDQLSRLEMMADGNDKWDLSPNDVAAISAVLRELNITRKALDLACEDATDVSSFEAEDYLDEARKDMREQP